MTSVPKATTALASALLALAMSVPAKAEPEIKAKLQIDDITCREALKMGGEERAFTVIFFHGFTSGRMNQTLFDGPALSEATDKIADYCIDNPSAKLITAFETIRKKAD